MKKTLEITEEQAKKLYTEASASFKEILESNFGKTTFLKNFQEAVKTYEDACEVIGEKPIDEQHFLNIGLTKSDIAYLKLKSIFKAENKMNNNWKPDYSDSDQYKFYPYIVCDSSGFHYKVSFGTNTLVGTITGSQFCCSTYENAEYIGKQFENLYNDYFDNP